DERTHCEQLCLSGFQAGLSWEIVLKKRDFLRAAFADFDPELVAGFDEARADDIIEDPRGIRNRRKVRSAINNARRVLEIRRIHGSFAAYVFQNLGGKIRTGDWTRWEDVPASTDESQALSDLLRKAGFTFFGPTIAYAYMQSVGLVNDHIVTCFKRQS
ncbi:DNA-3-methyladenine glycosylase I, partial [bacterium]|nr:DNA-3-methyladenine glycosylase I [bacterium]